MKTKVLIVGGGLAGLALAQRLQAAGHEWQLFEARNRWGGRVLTETVDGQGFDLGPSWFWPGQHRMLELVSQLNLKRFDQAYQGDLMYQDETGEVHRGQGMASMQGSWRLQGGLGQLIHSLVATLPASRLHLDSPVEQLVQRDKQIEVHIASGQVITATQVVLALPPRVAMQLNFTPGLSEQANRAASDISTWMAGHAKAVAIYKNAFWKEQGLSGDAMSRRGPLAEIHDASPQEGGLYALFGFVGTPVEHRVGNEEALKHAIRVQLGQIFGQDGLELTSLHLQDWALDSYTATELDHVPPQSHPDYGRPPALNDLWDGCLHFGSTEMGAQYGGFLEGALEVAEELADKVMSP